MCTTIRIVLAMVREAFLSRAALHLENLALRQQLAALDRKGARPSLRMADRLFWVVLSRLWSGWREILVIVKPETVIGWHRKGFRRFWTRKSRRGKPGRPPVSSEFRGLIRRMSRENPLWGAPRIHGELRMLGFEVSEAAVSKYMPRHPKPPSQTWRTFLENHVGCLASTDFFVVPTATFSLLFVLVVLRHERRRIVHIGTVLGTRRLAALSVPSGSKRHPSRPHPRHPKGLSVQGDSTGSRHTRLRRGSRNRSGRPFRGRQHHGI